MDKVIAFLQSKKLLAIACRDDEQLWIANVYYGADAKGTVYFISPENTKHSQMILKNSQVAFSVAWFDRANPKNRKAVQALGMCRPAATDEEIETGVRLHNQNLPEFKERITVEWVRNNEWGSKVWVLKPTFVKYWDDEVYGEAESEEFTLQ